MYPGYFDSSFAKIEKEQALLVVGEDQSKVNRARIVQRLANRSVGMTSRELARSLKLHVNDVNRDLLLLQNEGHVVFRGAKWIAINAQAHLAGNVSARTSPVNTRKVSATPKPLYEPEGEVSASTAGAEATLVTRIDKRNSRWGTFRLLCDYYAECVRLDQRSSIYSTAEEEFESIVCLDGSLPDTAELRVRTRESWHKWVRKLSDSDYLFIGYPLQRYRWRDTQKAKDVNFISPVYMVPCRASMDGTDLCIKPIGSIRINEGWLERRLKNVDERRAFLELCGIDSVTDTSIESTSWAECARLLNHFYPDWCAETLNPKRVSSSPALVELSKDGIYNRAGLIVPRKWKFTGGLYRELIRLSNEITDGELDRTALTHFFPHHAATKPSRPSDRSDETVTSEALIGSQALRLNHEQMLAARASAEANLSIVVGPPGTGKSRVVAAVLAQQALMDRSALAASRNHQALEAVVPRVNAITEPWPIMLRLARPWGAPADMSLQASIGQLVSSDLIGDRQHLENVRQALARRIEEQREASGIVVKIGDLREKVRKRTFDLEECLRRVPEHFQSELTVHHSELPTCEEVDNAIALLAELLPFRWSLEWLWDRIQCRGRIKRGIVAAGKIDNSLKRIFDKSALLPKAAVGYSAEIAAFYRQVLNFWRPVIYANQTMSEVAVLRRELEELPKTDEACRKEFEASNEVEALSANCLLELARQTGAEITADERSDLANILAAIENRSALDTDADHRRWAEAMRKAFPIFLRHFPLAATTNLSINRDINLEAGIFDLLIVDEASQCDIASVIPLLFRCKRAMIVGDPMQLSHVTSLSSATDRHLRRQFLVDDIELERYSYRTSSMFHLANTSKSVGSRVSLRQHHRCHPSIAAYCSETFYKGTWTVLTEETGKKGISWTDVPDDCQAAPGGGAISMKQIDRICAEVKRLSQDRYQGSVGVVTPFRQQANRLRDALHQCVPHDFILGSRLLVDTADGFQGDERDIVLFSLVAGSGLAQGSLSFLSAGPNRFNVAVSRAKQLLHVFGDISWARSCNIRHIKTLAEFCDREELELNRSAEAGFRLDLVGPVWEPALAEAMRNAGLTFHQQYPACGRYLDFALFSESLKLDVEVDGEAYHRSGSGDRLADDIRRDQALIANGWRVLRFWVYELREDMERCVANIAEVVRGSR